VTSIYRYIPVMSGSNLTSLEMDSVKAEVVVTCTCDLFVSPRSPAGDNLIVGGVETSGHCKGGGEIGAGGGFGGHCDGGNRNGGGNSELGRSSLTMLLCCLISILNNKVNNCLVHNFQ